MEPKLVVPNNFVPMNTAQQQEEARGEKRTFDNLALESDVDYQEGKRQKTDDEVCAEETSHCFRELPTLLPQLHLCRSLLLLPCLLRL